MCSLYIFDVALNGIKSADCQNATATMAENDVKDFPMKRILKGALRVAWRS